MFFTTAGLLLAIAVSLQDAGLPPPPGRLVEVDGRTLHLICHGTGTPAVIFEAGASAFAIDFSLVQTEVARITRACSYDRMGHGWSDPRGENDPDTVALLQALLRTAGEKPPYVLVGASRGGLYVRLYADRHPAEVVGMVLIDPAHEDRLFAMLDGTPVAIASLTAEQLRSTFTPVRSVQIPKRPPQTGTPFDRLPDDLYRTRIALDERLIASLPESVAFDVVLQAAETERRELARLRAQREQQSHPLGNRPLVILTRGMNTDAERDASFSRLMQLSSNARHEVVPKAGHEIHLFEPAVVVQAIRDVIESARSRARLRQRN